MGCVRLATTTSLAFAFPAAPPGKGPAGAPRVAMSGPITSSASVPPVAADERGYPPVSGHTVVQPDGKAVSEFGYTEAQVKQIRDMGGVIAINPPRGRDGLRATTKHFVEGYYDEGDENYVLGYNDIVAIMKEYNKDYPRIGLISDTPCPVQTGLL